MANRVRTIDEKVQAMEVALKGVNIERAAREAGVPASTLRYDLNKVRARLTELLSNHKPGPGQKKVRGRRSSTGSGSARALSGVRT
jgi:transposase-like protein